MAMKHMRHGVSNGCLMARILASALEKFTRIFANSCAFDSKQQAMTKYAYAGTGPYWEECASSNPK